MAYRTMYWMNIYAASLSMGLAQFYISSSNWPVDLPACWHNCVTAYDLPMTCLYDLSENILHRRFVRVMCVRAFFLRRAYVVSVLRISCVASPGTRHGPGRSRHNPEGAGHWQRCVCLLTQLQG